MPDYPPIDDYALVGDCHSAALISRAGSVDWWCPPQFDAAAVLCRILDLRKGGFWRVAPANPGTPTRGYRGETNVLETRWTAPGGQMRVTDFMPVQARPADGSGYDVGASHRIVRLVEALEGQVELEIAFKPSFDFAGAEHRVQFDGRRDGVVATSGLDHLALSCPGFDLQPSNSCIRATRQISAGEKYWLVLTYADNPDRALEALRPVNCEDELERTVRYWQDWSSQTRYSGPYRRSVARSALALKLLTYEASGAVVAAPTTSLPEQIGGNLNWDYRYSWLRDSSLVVDALMTVDHHQEAGDFMHWLEHVVGDDVGRNPQIVYGIRGEHQLEERTLDHLDGYRSSKPVRIGNAAYKQRQEDIYGELLRAAALHYARERPSDDGWRILSAFADDGAERWRRPGSGLWEVRGRNKQFVYSKAMCWAALDAAANLAERHRLPGNVDHWRSVADHIRQTVLERGFNIEVGAFTQSFGSTRLDASALMLPRIGIISADDSRMRSTVEQLKRHLTRNGLVYRHAPDGDAREGSFTLCTFWLVDVLAMQGHIDEAREVFEGALQYASDLDLFAEEIEPESGQQLGNFPQAFAHAALISTAVGLSSRSGSSAG